MNKYSKNKLLMNAIHAHKRIMTEGEAVDLVAINYEEGTPLDRVRKYNAYMILSKLDFAHDEATDPASGSAKYLDDLAAKDLPSEQIIQSLIEYRQRIEE